MKQHVEVKLLHGMLPTCPHEGCKSKLKIDSCSKFLTPRLIEIMSQRIKEASIPVTEKVYCPYPKCSALMSKSEVLEYSKSALREAARSGARNCIKCNGCFCIDCKVPWHNNMSCSDYKRRNPYPHPEDAKLKNLAATNLWRQCVKCNHMIELAAGCYHMTCRHLLCNLFLADVAMNFAILVELSGKTRRQLASVHFGMRRTLLTVNLTKGEEEDDEEYYDSDSDEYWIALL
ncbi:UNVERIFIED_CONTAM: hypothetical protein Scaly_0406900 [Sesamum calycinum]|uniref:RBR-type E3 ubiquitin transferase n=1 Tax=Sesamum calycinum TaxID=2727403 RepID=A0AAW2SFL2_9LAMI